MNLPIMRKRRLAQAVATLGPLLLLVSALFWLSLPHSRLEPGRRAALPAPAAQVAPAQDLGLVLTATVGLDPQACAATTGLRVLPGATVYACYTATNTGALTLTTHSLRDTRTGVIWDRQSLILAPGATTNTLAAGQALGGLANISATTFVTWTAQTAPNRVVTATANMRVDVVTPRLALTKTVGLDPATCSATVTRTVLPDADAFYCLTVRNTGDITLTRHALTDPTLDISRTFDAPLGPGGQLVLTDAALDQRGGAVDFASRSVSRTITNTIYYTAATISGYAANGVASVTGTTSSTVLLARPSVAFTKTVGTSSTECATTEVLTVSDPATLLYYCARVQNTGPITLTHHRLFEPALGLRVAFSHTLSPGSVITLNNATLLNDFGQSITFGPFTVYNGSNLVLDNTMYYTGTSIFTTTVTANANAFAGVNATPTPTGTPSPTPTGGSNDDDDDDPTDTPTVTFTPSFTPIPPTATPTFTLTPTPITPTPTPTRSYAISFLATPTPRFVSPLVMAADQAATQAALETTVAFEATAAFEAAVVQLTPTPLPAALSPLEPPLPTDTPSPALTLTLSPTAALVMIVVTNTPAPGDASTALSSTLPGSNGQRPIQLPPPTPTPDMLMLAARAFDGMMLAAGWIWFVLGSLIFFTVAGVLAGLAFHQRERHRFDLYEREDYPPPPPLTTPPGPDAAGDDWPASLP